MHTGDRTLLASVYPVLANIADYVERAVDPSTGLVTDLPSTNIYYDYPDRRPGSTCWASNVFRRTAEVAPRSAGRRRDRAAARRAQRALTDGDQRPAHPARRHLRRRARDRRRQVADGVAGRPTPAPSSYGVVPAANRPAVGAVRRRLGMRRTAEHRHRGARGAGPHRPRRRPRPDPHRPRPSTAGPTSSPAAAPSPGRCGSPPTSSATACRTAGDRTCSSRSNETLARGRRPPAPAYASFAVAPPPQARLGGGPVPTTRGPIAWRGAGRRRRGPFVARPHGPAQRHGHRSTSPVSMPRR